MSSCTRAALVARPFALFALLAASLCSPARAEWQTSIGAGARSVTHTEYGPAGNQLVREDGWLPGASLQTGYRHGQLAWSGAADWYQGPIDYLGRTQAGAGARSTTATKLATARLGASYTLGGYAILAAVELDRWKRSIRGTAAGAGLQESYRSTRLLLGAGTHWQPAMGKVALEASALLAAPERMHIGFSGLYDPVTLDTRRGHGLRLGAALRPNGAPALELRGRADWLSVPRSGEAALTAQGAFRGTVTQPEHVRRGLTLELAYLF
jgi:hypothetical protein